MVLYYRYFIYFFINLHNLHGIAEMFYSVFTVSFLQELRNSDFRLVVLIFVSFEQATPCLNAKQKVEIGKHRKHK